MQYGPNPNSIYPNEKIKSVCFIKNIITRPNIIVGDYTYYDDINGAERFEEHVTHHYEFLGDKFKGRLSSGSTVFACRPVADKNLRENRVPGQLLFMGKQLPIRCFMSAGSVLELQFCGMRGVVS